MSCTSFCTLWMVCEEVRLMQGAKGRHGRHKRDIFWTKERSTHEIIRQGVYRSIYMIHAVCRNITPCLTPPFIHAVPIHSTSPSESLHPCRRRDTYLQFVILYSIVNVRRPRLDHLSASWLKS